MPTVIVPPEEWDIEDNREILEERWCEDGYAVAGYDWDPYRYVYLVTLEPINESGPRR